ncbi:MAG: hypothetical protein K5662_00300 [Lachnospiraceae bacterium]|nr:hypothetical protein [Lachnospiraceae bacterium]
MNKRFCKRTAYLIMTVMSLNLMLQGCGSKEEVELQEVDITQYDDPFHDGETNADNVVTAVEVTENSEDDKADEANGNSEDDKAVEVTENSEDDKADEASGNSEDDKADESSVSSEENKADDRSVTEDMAYEGVSNYCHTNYDWSVAEEGSAVMYVEMGEGTETEYEVVFRSYTGAFVHFYVDKRTGIARMIEEVPALEVKSEAGIIDIHDYLKGDN